MKSRVLTIIFTLLVVANSATAQNQVTTSEAEQPKKPPIPRPQERADVIVQPQAPQVVTILHRLNGLKMFRLMLRSDEKFSAIAQLDDAFKIKGGVHTNVIAGLALNDGQTIIAWLPEAEAELGPPLMSFSPTGQEPAWASKAPMQPAIPAAPFFGAAADVFEAPDLTVVAQDGKRSVARYVGFDGVTGLSVLKVTDKTLSPRVAAYAEAVNVGQRLRLIGPEPATAPAAGEAISVRVGQTPGTVTNVTQAPTGGVLKVKLRSPRLSSTNLGGIAVTDTGDTVGIVNTINKGEASILSTIQIGNAARRVLEKQASVPRPWLGVRGEPIAALAPDYLLHNGWREQQAFALKQDGCGILLTSVSPGSPAALAALRPGDVILRVNGEDIRSGDDFSWFLDEVGPGGSASFTVMRPGQNTAEAIKLKLSGSLDSFLGPAFFESNGARNKEGLLHKGIETVALKRSVAERFFGADGGLLVVYVQPDSDASRAGVRAGDVIERINGEQPPSSEADLSNLLGSNVAFDIVRGKQKLTVTIRE